MKTLKAPVSKALLEVWEAKRAVYEDTKDMTTQEVLAYFEQHSQQLADDLGKRWVKNSDGTSFLV